MASMVVNYTHISILIKKIYERIVPLFMVTHTMYKLHYRLYFNTLRRR